MKTDKFKNFDKALARLMLALRRREKIGIWGDYDPDGIPATFLIYSVMLKLGFAKKDLSIILPGKKKYYRGFNSDYLNFLKKKKTSLILGVDFGTSDFKQVAMAKKMGFDVILFDHHVQRAGKLEAILVNHMQGGDRFPYKNWSGTGVAYKFFEYVFKEKNMDLKELEEFLDVFSFAMSADGIKIDAGNRTYFEKGVKLLNSKKRTGIKALLGVTGQGRFGKNLTVWGKSLDYVFRSALHGENRGNNLFKLLLADDKKEAEAIAADIGRRLKSFTDIVDRNVRGIMEKYAGRKLPPVIFWEEKSGRDSATSMVAHETNYRLKTPIFVYHRFGDEYRGITRIIYPPGLDSVESMKTCAPLLLAFGGHPVAAGYRLKAANMQKFKKAMEKYFSKIKSSRHGHG